MDLISSYYTKESLVPVMPVREHKSKKFLKSNLSIAIGIGLGFVSYISVPVVGLGLG